MGYPFLDNEIYYLIRHYGNQILYGIAINNYASNGTNCWNMGINLAQYDLELLIIKYMYGDLKDNILNTTLFMQNISSVGYVCVDALENIYVWSMYKFELFSFNYVNVVLGFVQNVLGNILTVNKIY